ncbi:MAG: NAD(P)(+) transhydrogenase (Re/Si-specific) subunit beta [Candidatus Competibacteraceae bacterium]|jgi:H+-translocating NAD(P) transhydrogenase subunit beta|nr:MAG: NAD(P)(+) transhydrogenase (Re/Si-specific) subunit beta [Candidatus Competibacteraceae bacterium]
MGHLIELSYFLTAVLFIVGLKRMSHPTTARSGILWAGAGMLLATLVTFLHPQIAGNYLLMIAALMLGSAVAWYSAKKVEMTAMPQMIAVYNGMGGGAAAAIAAVTLLGGPELWDHAALGKPLWLFLLLAVLGAMIGSISFSGSIIAFAKLQEYQSFRNPLRFIGQQKVNAILFGLMFVLGLIIALSGSDNLALLAIFFLLALALGIMIAMPIGGADMPVVVSLFNALTGLAVAFEGYVLNNSAMIIAGIIVGSAGSLLTHLMAKAMNRSITNILFSSWDALGSGGQAVTGSMKSMEPPDAAIQMAYASKVIIVPGYGMAVAQAQHKLWEMCRLLIENGVDVKFAIHPVAGRMPGHMNVLLAEAGVPYDLIFDLEEINADFPTADVALVIGANDVVNPAARNDKSSPIYGMPILNVDYAKNVQVIKRGKGVGFAGIENALFFSDNTRMVYGDAQKVVAGLIQGIKELN